MICAPADHTPSSEPALARARRSQARTGANQIKVLEYCGAVISDEMTKLKVFTNYYYMLLGTEIQLAWHFDT